MLVFLFLEELHIASYFIIFFVFLVGESDPFNGLGLVRRRRTSSIESSPSKPCKSEKPEKKNGDKKSKKSAKKPREHWKSEIITTNLKIRIRSPESDGGNSVAVKQEDGPPVLTPQNTSPSGILKLTKATIDFRFLNKFHSLNT